MTIRSRCYNWNNASKRLEANEIRFAIVLRYLYFSIQLQLPGDCCAVLLLCYYAILLLCYCGIVMLDVGMLVCNDQWQNHCDPDCEAGNIYVLGNLHHRDHNTNPLVIRFVSGNIRVCHAVMWYLPFTRWLCTKTTLRQCVARSEKTVHTGALLPINTGVYRIMNLTHITVHVWHVFSMRTLCLLVLTALVVPEEVRSKLNDVHKSYLSYEFSLFL